MHFLQGRDKEIVEKRLGEMEAPVTLRHFTQEADCDYCLETVQLLEELTGFSGKLRLEIHDWQIDRDRARTEEVDRVPATKIIGARDHGVHYYGIPSGFEFPALLEDILMVSKRESGLSAVSRQKLAQITEPVLIQVFVTPTCPYCSGAVHLAHMFAMESDLVTAEMIEATEFPDLADRYDVSGVPLTVVNGKVAAQGMLSESVYLDRILEVAGPATGGRAERS